MDAYIYQAALICEHCALDIMTDSQIVDHLRYDSDTFPQGPYSNGGGESDSPENCDLCYIFLENPLTSDGVEYVREIIAKHPQRATAQEWAEFYKDALC